MEPSTLYLSLFGVGTTLGLLLLLRLGQRLFSRSLAQDLSQGNAAKSLLQVGQVLAIFLVASSTVKGVARGADLQRDVLWVAAFGVAGLALVMLTGHLGVRLLLRARLPAEVERGNVAAGVAAGAHYVATGIITARALGGDNLRELGLSVAFFTIAELTLLCFVTLFRVLTTYDDAEQIQGENLAASLSYAGVSIAISVIVARALEGDFVSWSASLRSYGAVLLSLLALYPARQILVQVVLLGAPFTLRGGRLDEGVAKERDAALGTLEAVTYLAVALSIAQLL